MLQKNTFEPAQKVSDPDAIDMAAREQPRRSVLTMAARGLAQLLLMAAVLGLAFFVTNRLVATKPEVPKRPIFPTVYTVDTVTATPANHQPTMRVYGEVIAARNVELRSLVSGQVTSVNPKLRSGGRVTAGEVLLTIDRFNFEGALREARANLAEAQARLTEADSRKRLEESRLASGREQLELARNDLQRIEELRRRGTATEKQVEDRRLVISQRQQAVEQSELTLLGEDARIEQLQANLERLRWRVEQAERDLANTQLTAPFDATVRSSNAEEGKLVSANDVVVSMYQQDALEARFVLTDARFSRLQADEAGITDRPVSVIWTAGGTEYRYEGKIERIGAEITSASGGVEMYASIDTASGPLGLRPGAFVALDVPDRLFADHYRLPETAIYEGNKVYVAVDGELQERVVAIAGFDGSSVLVAEGLTAGDEVLTTRISEISSGLKVRREGDPEPPRGGQQDRDADRTAASE